MYRLPKLPGRAPNAISAPIVGPPFRSPRLLNLPSRYNGLMPSSPKLTRRRIGALLATAGAATQIADAQAPARAEGDPDLEAARLQARNNAQLIGQVKLPMTTEPAFQFK